MKYKHIIWDWNGTLLNDLTLCVDLLNVSLEKRKLPEMTEEKYRKKFLFPIKTFYESIGFDFSKEDFTLVRCSISSLVSFRCVSDIVAKNYGSIDIFALA